MILLLLLLLVASSPTAAQSPSTPWEPYLRKNVLMFLVRSDCPGPAVPDDPKATFVDNSLALKTTKERDDPNCKQTFGILPISAKRARIYVTVDSDTAKAEMFYHAGGRDTNVTHYYKLLFTCYKAGQPFVPIQPSLKLKVRAILNDEGKRYLPPIDNVIYPCDGMDVEMAGTGDLATALTDALWMLKLTSVTGSVRKVIGKFANSTDFVADYKKRLRCDPDSVVQLREADDRIQRPLVRNDRIVYTPDTSADQSRPATIHYDTSAACAPNTGVLAYLVDGDTTLTQATSLRCEQNNQKGAWAWTAKSPSGDTRFEGHHVIKAGCVQLKCRMCRELEPSTQFTGAVPIKQFGQLLPPFPQCYRLSVSTECAGFFGMLVNNERVYEGELDDLTCDSIESEYLWFGEYPVKSLACASGFMYQSALNRLNMDAKSIQTAGAQVARNPNHGSTFEKGINCVNAADRLAFLDKTGKSWLRVSSLKFDNLTDHWKYTRKNKDQTELEYVLKENRTIGCIDTVAEVKFEDWPRNPGAKWVYLANGVTHLLAGSLIVIIVTVAINRRKTPAKGAPGAGKKGALTVPPAPPVPELGMGAAAAAKTPKTEGQPEAKSAKTAKSETVPGTPNEKKAAIKTNPLVV